MKRKRIYVSDREEYGVSFFEALPPEIVEEVLLFCNFDSLWNLSQTCKFFRNVMKNTELLLKILTNNPRYRLLRGAEQGILSKRKHHRLRNLGALIKVDRRRTLVENAIRGKRLHFIHGFLRTIGVDTPNGVLVKHISFENKVILFQKPTGEWMEYNFGKELGLTHGGFQFKDNPLHSIYLNSLEITPFFKGKAVFYQLDSFFPREFLHSLQLTKRNQ